MVKPAGFWQGRRVLITGHTGFKGGWLALWLNELGAEVWGYALPPPTEPSLFHSSNIGELLESSIGNICEQDDLHRCFDKCRPQTVFHLAAQPIVSEGYRDPVGTYATNVMGTVNVLEASRTSPSLERIVVVTTDKCYDNTESLHDYAEEDPLGGRDPYSSSKACTELLSAAYRASFFSAPNSARLATARAGNVIGGGDWATNRLVPDLLRAYSNGQPARLRHPDSIRPWQHVLEPLAGYLLLAEKLCTDGSLARAWNFAPSLEDCVTPATLANLTAEMWGTSAKWTAEPSTLPYESQLLRLNADRARQVLKWRPKWPLHEAVRHTVAWHRAWLSGHEMQAFSRDQINQYMRAAHNFDEP